MTKISHVQVVLEEGIAAQLVLTLQHLIPALDVLLFALRVAWFPKDHGRCLPLVLVHHYLIGTTDSSLQILSN